MKKVLFAVLFLAGCQSNESKLTARAEAYLKTQLKDPSSYQPIKNGHDTTMLKAFLEDHYTADTTSLNTANRKFKTDSLLAIIDGMKGQELEDFCKILRGGPAIYKNSADRNRQELDTLKADRIFSINFRFNYRSKNGMGALDVGESTIKYYPSDSSFTLSK